MTFRRLVGYKNYKNRNINKKSLVLRIEKSRKTGQQRKKTKTSFKLWVGLGGGAELARVRGGYPKETSKKKFTTQLETIMEQKQLQQHNID